MTLAYKYKNTTPEIDEKICQEVAIFNMLLKDQTITILAPKVCEFHDMTKFDEWEPEY
jgi:hypothetical protein